MKGSGHFLDIGGVEEVVSVEEGEEFGLDLTEAKVAGGANSTVGRIDERDAGVLELAGLRPGLGAVVDDDGLPSGVRLIDEALEAGFEELSGVVGGDDERDFWGFHSREPSLCYWFGLVREFRKSFRPWRD